MKFKLEITLGNDSMQTNEDVAETLKNLAVELCHQTHHFNSSDVSLYYQHAQIWDKNGNKVGSWHVSVE